MMADLMQAGEPYTVATTLTVAGQPIPIETAQLTLTESGQDYLSLKTDLAGPLPAPIDARLAPAAVLTTTVAYPDRGITDPVHTWALVAREARSQITFAAEEHTLVCQGRESLVRDDNARVGKVFTSSSLLVASLSQVLTAVIPGVAITSEIDPALKFLEGTDTLEWEPTTNAWALITQMCDSAVSLAEVECFYNGAGFVIRYVPGIGVPKFTFSAGEAGNLARWETTTSRDSFYNAVQVKTATATQTYESFDTTVGVTVAGRRLATEETGARAGSGTALRRAKVQTQRAIRTGLTAQLSTSALPLGLTPGDTIDVKIRGTSTRWVISSIIFDLAAGGANLTLRKDA